jgi:hypothetical protein
LRKNELMLKLNFFAIAFCCLAMTSCHRVIISGQHSHHTIQKGEKVFVQLVAPFASEEESQKLIPMINRALRERGYLVASSLENVLTTPEWRERSIKRLADFAPDYVLKIEQKKDEVIIYPYKGKPKEFLKTYDLSMTQMSTKSIVWKGSALGKPRLFGFYSKKISYHFLNMLEQDAVISAIK